VTLQHLTPVPVKEGWETMQPIGDNFTPVIPNDEVQHTAEEPFCFVDPTCPCHEDENLIAQVAQDVLDGLLTPTEATRTVKGDQL